MARCGDVHLLNEPSVRSPLFYFVLIIGEFQTSNLIDPAEEEHGEHLPLPIYLKLDLQVIDPWSSSICQISCKADSFIYMPHMQAPNPL